jgi:SnoaL-like domain
LTKASPASVDGGEAVMSRRVASWKITYGGIPCSFATAVRQVRRPSNTFSASGETWTYARDAGDWDDFRACWHEDGYMMATWYQGPKEDFIRVSQVGRARGINILHFIGGCHIALNGTRAIARTRMTIMQRGEVEGVLCDVACTGRFYDFMDQRDGRWAMVFRQPIYEKDRLDPAASLSLDAEILARFPEGYRFLAYLQQQAGYPVKTDMPGLAGPEVERLYERGTAWLAGQPVAP